MGVQQDNHRLLMAEAEAAILAAGKEGDIGKALRAVDDYKIAKLKYDAVEASRLVRNAISALQAAVRLLEADQAGDGEANEAPGSDQVRVFRRFKGRLYEGTLNLRTGEVDTGGVTYAAPSPAAMSITISNANGWDWWRYLDQQGREQKIATLR